jgi:hypothetical protein
MNGKQNRVPSSSLDDILKSLERPSTLVDWAIKIMYTSDPSLKVEHTFKAAQLWEDGLILEVMDTLMMCQLITDNE